MEIHANEGFKKNTSVERMIVPQMPTWAEFTDGLLWTKTGAGEVALGPRGERAPGTFQRDGRPRGCAQ